MINSQHANGLYLEGQFFALRLDEKNLSVEHLAACRAAIEAYMCATGLHTNDHTDALKSVWCPRCECEQLTESHFVAVLKTTHSQCSVCGMEYW